MPGETWTAPRFPYRKVLELGRDLGAPAFEAVALGNLSTIYTTLGELEKAETAHNKVAP